VKLAPSNLYGECGDGYPKIKINNKLVEACDYIDKCRIGWCNQYNLCVKGPEKKCSWPQVCNPFTGNCENMGSHIADMCEGWGKDNKNVLGEYTCNPCTGCYHKLPSSFHKTCEPLVKGTFDYRCPVGKTYCDGYGNCVAEKNKDNQDCPHDKPYLDYNDNTCKCALGYKCDDGNSETEEDICKQIENGNVLCQGNKICSPCSENVNDGSCINLKEGTYDIRCSIEKPYCDGHGNCVDSINDEKCPPDKPYKNYNGECECIYGKPCRKGGDLCKNYVCDWNTTSKNNSELTICVEVKNYDKCFNVEDKDKNTCTKIYCDSETGECKDEVKIIECKDNDGCCPQSCTGNPLAKEGYDSDCHYSVPCPSDKDPCTFENRNSIDGKCRSDPITMCIRGKRDNCCNKDKCNGVINEEGNKYEYDNDFDSDCYNECGKQKFITDVYTNKLKLISDRECPNNCYYPRDVDCEHKDVICNIAGIGLNIGDIAFLGAREIGNIICS
jgi:hypothetical protein